MKILSKDDIFNENFKRILYFEIANWLKSKHNTDENLRVILSFLFNYYSINIIHIPFVIVITLKNLTVVKLSISVLSIISDNMKIHIEYFEEGAICLPVQEEEITYKQ